MIKRCVSLLFSLLLLTTTVYFGQAQLTIDGQFRPRGEYRNGYRTLPDSSSEPAAFISQRMRLSFNYVHEKVDVHIALQDVRVWGDEAHLQDVASTAVHETWAKIKFFENYHLKVGRQELVYDDHRLLGNVNWTQQARSHDAAVFMYRREGWKLDVGGAFNQARQNVFGTDYPIKNYKTLAYLWGHKTFGDHFKLSVLGFSDSYQSVDTSQTTLFRYTYGLHNQYMNNGLSLQLTLYGQSGQDRNYNKIFAFMGSFQAGYQINKLKLTAGIDYLSGNDATDTSNTVNNSFHTLYATNHKFYGFMDYFLNIPNDTWGGGLQDAYLKVKYNMSEKVSAALDYHYFALTNKLLDPSNPTQTLKPGLGNEFDAVMSYQWNDFITFKGGYSILLPTRSMETIKRRDTGQMLVHWGWLMVDIQPTLFSAEK